MHSKLGRIVLFGIIVTAFWCCTEYPGFLLGEADRASNDALSVDEAAINAVLRSDGVTIIVPVSRESASGALDGTVFVRLADLNGNEYDSSEVEFNFADGEETVHVELDTLAGADDGTEENLLGSFIVQYEVLIGEERLSGSRSLSTIISRLASVVMGPDDLFEDETAYYHLIARDPTSGQPLPNTHVEVALATEIDGEISETIAWSGETDEVGMAQAEVTAESIAGAATLVIRMENDGRSIVSRHSVNVQRAHRILLTTDKPLYQPGQDIHIRALSFRLPNNTPSAGADAVFEVVDSAGNIVHREEQQTNEYGIASTVFGLARQVNMGRYTIRATIDEAVQERTVTVDRYALPRFGIDFESDRAFYMPGEVLQGQIDADYTFGEPVAGASVVVRASQFDVDWTEFAETRGTTDAEGVFDFEIELPTYFVGLPLEGGGSFVRLSIEVTDTAGQTYELERGITIARGAVTTYIVPERPQLAPGVENEIYILTADPTGEPLSTTCSVTVGSAPSFPIETNERGMATFTVVPTSEAPLTILIEADDGRDGTAQAAITLSTNGTDEETVLLRTDRSIYEVGQTAELSLYSPRLLDRMYIDVVRSGQTMLTDIVPVESGWNTVPIDLTESMTGPVTVSVYYIADSGDIIRDSRIIYVSGASDLTLSMEVDQESYRPGESANLSIQVLDAEGEGVQSAIGLQVVDESVFLLSEQDPGLQRLYFEIEAELSEPAYEVHGYRSGDILGDGEPDVEDDETQDAARVLFAAGGGQPVHDIDYSSERERQALDTVSSQNAVNRDASAVAAHITDQLPDIDEDDAEDYVEEWVNRHDDDLFDPWGQAYQVTVSEAAVTLRSAGCDEIWETDDDLSATGYVDLWEADPDPSFGCMAADSADVARGDGDGDADGDGDGDADGDADSDADADGDGDGTSGEPRIRSWFPETLFVEPSIITDDNGAVSVPIELADTITTWRASAIASTRRGQLGSQTMGIRVFQEFFVDLALPATLTLGDEITVPVVVYNYLDEEQTVTIEVEDESWFTLLSPATQALDLGPSEIASVPLRIRVEQVGWHSLQAIGRAGDVADGLRRRIEVMPSGRRFDETQSDMLNATEEGTHVEFNFDVPANSVPDASELLVKVYPGVMSQAIEGLDSILSMPYGCFEQTSSATYPNVMVLHYMQETDSITPEIEIRAREYISQGYQRLLTYEVDGGGFEWFGEAPAHRILTAYGLMEFTDMARVHPVDPAVITRTAAWLASQQTASGAWEPDPSGIQEGAINNYQNDTYRTTAYILWALIESGYEGSQVERGLQYVRDHQDEAANSYSRAVAAQALLSADRNDTIGLALLDQLAEDATLEGEEESQTALWGVEEGASGLTYSMGDAHALETTALTIDAFFRAGRHLDLASAGLAFLVQNKDAYGNFQTTQATIYALRAMIRSMSAATSVAEGTIDVYHNGALIETIEVDETNSDVMRQVDLKEHIVEGGPNTVELVMTGSGSLMYQTVGTYWMPWSDVPEEPLGAISIDVSYDRTNLEVDDTATVDVSLTNNTSGSLMMVMVDLGIPPGFDLLSDDLDELVSLDVIERYDSTPRQLLLYFDEIEAGPSIDFSYRIVARNPMRGEAPPSTAYLYYDPDVRVMAPPVILEVDE